MDTIRPVSMVRHGLVAQSTQEREQARETQALLKVLAMGEQEISDEKTMAAKDVFTEAERMIDRGQS